MPTLPKSGFWTRKPLKTTRFTMFSRAPTAENHAFYDVFPSFLRPKNCGLSRNLRKTRPLRKKNMRFYVFFPGRSRQNAPPLPRRGFWTRKSVKTTRFTMFSRARSWKTMRFTMFSRVFCVRKGAGLSVYLRKTRPLRKKT